MANFNFVTRRRFCAMSSAGAVAATTPFMNLRSANASEYTMRLAHVLEPGHPRDRLMHRYAEAVHQRSDERIKVEVFPSGQLGDNTAVTEGIQQGVVQGTINPTSFMGGFRPILGVLDYPFLFPSLDVGEEVANSDVGRELMAEVEEIGIKGLAIYGEADKHFGSNFPLRSPSDLEGKRMRVIASPVLDDLYRTWGSTPVPMGLPEVYSALQTGVVDGLENQWGLFNDFKMYEVLDHFTEIGHGLFLEFFYISKAWYDDLPPDLQKIIVEEAQALRPARLKWAHEDLDESREKLKGLADFYSLSPEERDAFREAAMPVYDNLSDRTGDKGTYYMEKLEAEAKKLSG